MNVLALLQARVSSSRLPGKVLKPILGEPMLVRQIERLRGSTLIEQLVVATSGEPSDDPIAGLCEANGVACYRGSLDDVLDRFYQAAIHYRPEHLVRLTGDCPLADPAVIDQVIRVHLAHGNDYTSNCLAPSFPDGLDVEVFRMACLEAAWQHARLPSHREHVTPYIREPSNHYQLENVSAPHNLGQLRWTVDEPEDFSFVTAVYESLYCANARFAMADILDLLGRHPELENLNKHLVRNAGFQKTLEADRLFRLKDKRHHD